MCASQMATIKLNWNTQTLQLGFNVSCLIPTLHWLLSRLWNLSYRVKKIPGIYGINFILEQCWDICLLFHMRYSSGVMVTGMEKLSLVNAI